MKYSIPICLALVISISCITMMKASDDSTVPDGTIYGHVYDADTKQPLSQAFVFCQEVDCPKKTSDSKGYYEIESCFSPSETFIIQCIKNGYDTSSKTVKTNAKGTAMVDFPLSKEGSVDTLLKQPAVKNPDYKTHMNETLASATSPNLQYVWSVAGIMPGQITMALSQGGNRLLGAAKYEPDDEDPWNAEVLGKIEGNEVRLAIEPDNHEDALFILKGIFNNGAISGQFYKFIGEDLTREGDFSAFSINPDIDSYTPAEVSETKRFEVKR